MYVRTSPLFALLVALGSLAGCSGGGGAVGSATFTCVGSGSNVICLQNCSLGCTETGCGRTDIAQNEIIILTFSQDIDPVSVSPSSIRFRTASGDQPVGEYFVTGNRVEFVPTLSVSGGQTFFGFTTGETYTMTIPSTGASVVRSTSGKPFVKTLSCTLRSSLGVVDQNGVPPAATLISPTSAQLAAAPRDINIVLEFNELIDVTPFLGTGSPVNYSVRRTRLTQDPNDGDARECDPASPLVPLGGSSDVQFDAARRVSVVTFRPASPLPANVCIEVLVTNLVTDLSGKAAQPQQFLFQTVTVPLADFPITEEFVDTAHFDDEASAGTWGSGSLGFARIGGDGRHGTFSTSLGVDQGIIAGKRTYLFNTDNTIIPAANTTTGSPLAVTDGRFFFDKMVVPSDVRLRFVGSSPPVFTVAGRLDLQGEIDIVGQSNVPVPLPGTATIGQAGTAGGIFGGSGGKGGDRSLNTTVPDLTPYNGANGQGVRVQAGHAYGSAAAATGGRGSSMFPANGLSTSLIYPSPLPLVACTPSAAAGGGGGGMFQAGVNGRVVTNNHPNGVGNPPPLLAAMGPDGVGGSAMTFFPFPAATGSTRSSVHFLVGGSGGGGAGSQACLSPHTLIQKWVVGGGGAGGGGAVALRAGSSLRIGPLGKVVATGGNTPGSSGPTALSVPAPGGAGSGGSVVLQSGNLAEILGVVDVRGGSGGLWVRSANGNPPVVPNSAAVTIAGGNGSPGFVRLETPGTPTTTMLATMLPAPVAENVATLVERDDLVGVRSNYYSTGLVFGPEYARYEIYATVDGVPTVFSDDSAVSTIAAQVGASIRVLFQAATLDLTTNAVLATGPWRTSVRSSPTQTGIQSDGLNGFRFQLIQDTTLSTNVVVDKVVVVYRN